MVYVRGQKYGEWASTTNEVHHFFGVRHVTEDYEYNLLRVSRETPK